MFQVTNFFVKLLLLSDSDFGHASKFVTHSSQLGGEIGRNCLFFFLKVDNLDVFCGYILLIIGDHLA